MMDPGFVNMLSYKISQKPLFAFKDTLKHIRMSDGKRKGNVALLNWLKKILTKSAILIIP